MGIYRGQWCLQGPGGDARDRYCNTWHFKYDAGDITAETPGVAVTIYDALWEFYNEIAPAIYGSAINRAGAVFKLYRLADPPDSPPVYSNTLSGSPFDLVGTGLNLPAECAICLSFEGTAAPGTNRARRRGRVYLGPCDTGTLETTGDFARVKASVLTAIMVQYEALWNSLDTDNIEHGVWSPTDSLFVRARHAWVDNAFDTQRRRGAEPSDRVEATLS